MGNGTPRAAQDTLHRHWPLVFVVIGFLLLALLYSWATPPFEGPDEPQHFAYIKWLAQGRGFPPQGEAAWQTDIEQESGQPPLYYLLALLPVRLIDIDDPPATYRPNPHFVGPSPREIFDNDNRAIHYPSDEQPLRGGWLALRLSRLVTITFGAVLIIGVYVLVYQLRPSLALAAATLVAFTPQVLYISAVASNDIPAAAMSTLSLVCLVALMRRTPSPSRGLAFAAGLFAGLAALAKVSALILAAPLAVGLLWLWLGARENMAEVFKKGLFIAGGTLLACGWWFLRVARLYGSPLGIATHNDAPWAIDDPEALTVAWARWLEVIRYYWIALGWGTIRPEDWVYSIFFGLVLLAAIGLLVAAWRYGRARRISFQDPVVAFSLVFASLILANILFLEVWMRRVIAPYGRLLFPSIGAITLSLLIGWSTLHRRFLALPLAFILILGLVTPLAFIRPAYTPQSLVDAASLAEAPAIGWRFGDTADEPIAELLSVTPASESVANRAILEVDVCWRVLARAPADYEILMHIIGPENSLVAQRRTYPGRGLLPTSQWQPGSIICDPILIRLKAPWAKTLVYQIELHMIEGKSGRRLVATDAQGSELEGTFINMVRVFDPETTADRVTEFNGDDPLQLISFSSPDPVYQAGDTLELDLEWSASRDVDQDYQVFMHLRDQQSGELVAQADGPPLDGWYPTSWWPVGERVRDTWQLTLDESLPPGTYDIVTGFYDLNTLQPAGGGAHLGTIRVES